MGVTHLVVVSWATFTHLWKKKQTSPVQFGLHACSWGGCSGFNVNFETGVEVFSLLHMVTGILVAISDFIFKKMQEPAHMIWLCFCWNNRRRQRPPWRTAHRKMTTISTLQSPWEPLAAWRKGQLRLTKEKWLFNSSALSVSDHDTLLISDKSHHSYTNVARKSGEWVMHAEFIDLQEAKNQRFLTHNHSQHCPWAVGVALLSLPAGTGASCLRAGWWIRFGLLFLCAGWVMFQAVLLQVLRSRAAPRYFWSCAQVRSQEQYLWVSCRIWDYLHALMCPNIQMNEDANVHCSSAGSGILQESDWSLWAKGDLSYNSPSSHRSHLGHEGMGGQVQPQSCAPSGDKNCLLSFSDMVF